MTDKSGYRYGGGELELFSDAVRWKNYWNEKLSRYFTGSVLEVGAGLGTNVPFLWNSNVVSWLCLEPDGRYLAEIEKRIHAGTLPKQCNAFQGTTQDLPAAERFDTIAYLDVLEHIEDDLEELRYAAHHLNTQGRLIVLAPAHGWLFSEFDRAVGHYRRYAASSLLRLTPPDTYCEACFYLDSVGLLASLGNRFLFRQSMPTKRQIALWDRVLVRASRGVDRLCNFKFGKTVIAVWRKGNPR